MLKPTIVQAKRCPSRVAYAVQLLGMKREVPDTSEDKGVSFYKRIDDDIVVGITTGHWTTNFFACFNGLVSNAFMATLCPCVSLAQIARRLGIVPYFTALLFFLLLCSLELVAVALTIQQFISVVILHHNVYYSYFHAHRLEENRSAINLVFVTDFLLAHMVFATALLVLRKQIRSQFQIPGTTRNDILSVTCCPCFSIAQMASHLRCDRPNSCILRPVDVLPRYQ